MNVMLRGNIYVPIERFEILTEKVYTIVEIDDRETEEQMLAARTDKQKESQDAYMEKLQDIKVRVPKEYYDKIQSYTKLQGLSINKLVISLLEKEIGEKYCLLENKIN